MTTSGTRARRAGRRLTVGAVWVIALTAGLALGGPFALRPFVDVAGAASDVGVAFVIDFGGTSGQVTGCVTVPASDNGYAALAAFATQEHLQGPRYSSSDLLCSIDGIPAIGCGQATSAGYIYWSYFRGGTGTWAYASTGAFATVTTGDVEGWRFQDPGTGKPNDPPPRVAPDSGALCPPSVSTTPATSPAPAPYTPAEATPATSAPESSAVAPPGSPGSPNSPGASGNTVPTGSGPTTTTGPAAAPRSPAPRILNPSSSSVHLGSTVATTHGPGGSGYIPLVVGSLIAAALAVAAGVRWRKRPRT